MEKGLSINEKIGIIKGLREEWDHKKISDLELAEYTKLKVNQDRKNPTFTYVIESGDFSKVASIGSGPSTKFCIYAHKSPSTAKNTDSYGLYSWYKSYGKSSTEAFNETRKELQLLIETCRNNENTNNFDWVYNENIKLGADFKNPTNYKKALVFLYQKANIEETTIIPIFNQQILECYIKYENLTLNTKDYYQLQKFLIEKYNIQNLSDAIKKSVEIWEFWENRHPIISKVAKDEIPNKDRDVLEGELQEKIVLSRKRNAGIVTDCKIRDKYKCQSCYFNYDKAIVEAHHLKPLSLAGKSKVNSDNLITLCPTCHRIAHYLLSKNKNKNKELIIREKLIPEIQKIFKESYK